MAFDLLSIAVSRLGTLATDYLVWNAQYQHCWERLPIPCRPGLSDPVEAFARKPITVSRYEYGYLTLPAPTAPSPMFITLAPNAVPFVHKGTAQFEFPSPMAPSSSHVFRGIISVACILATLVLLVWFLFNLLGEKKAEKAKVSKLSEENGLLNSKLDRLRASIMKTFIQQAIQKEKIQQSLGENGCLSSTVDRFKALVIKLLSEQTNHKARVHKLADENGRLSSAVDRFKAFVIKLLGEQANHKARISELVGENGRLSVKVDQFKGFVMRLLSEQTTHKVRLGVLVDENGRLRSKINGFKSLAVSLMRDKTSLQERVAYLETELDKARSGKTAQETSFAVPSTMFNFSAPGLQSMALGKASSSVAPNIPPIFGLPVPQSKALVQDQPPSSAVFPSLGLPPNPNFLQPENALPGKTKCKNKSPSQRRAAKRAKEEAAKKAEEEAHKMGEEEPEKKADDEKPNKEKESEKPAPPSTSNPETAPKQDLPAPSAEQPTSASTGQATGEKAKKKRRRQKKKKTAGNQGQQPPNSS